MRPLCPCRSCCCLLLFLSLGVQGAPEAAPEQVHLSYPGKFCGHFWEFPREAQGVWGLKYPLVDCCGSLGWWPGLPGLRLCASVERGSPAAVQLAVWEMIPASSLS